MQSKQPRKQAKKGEGSPAVASKDWRQAGRSELGRLAGFGGRLPLDCENDL